MVRLVVIVVVSSNDGGSYSGGSGSLSGSQVVGVVMVHRNF